MLEQLNSSLPWNQRAQSVPGALHRLRTLVADDEPKASGVHLHLLCRTMDQLKAAVELKPEMLIADFQDLREYREAVELCRSAGLTLLLAPPRIQKPGEIGLFRLMLKAEPDGVLVRNLSGLQFFRDHGISIVGDYSLNVTNELTAQFLKSQSLRWLTPSYDLNRDQLSDLVSHMPASWLEVVIHQHMPMFHMEHCVFCSVISPGTNKTNCGRPCDRHDVQLRDRLGVEHVLHADIGCRNTLFNGVAQSGAEAVPNLLKRGVQNFRIEFLRDAPVDEVRQHVELYEGLLAGRWDGAHVWKTLRAVNRLGVTRGTLEHPRNPLAIL